MGRVLLFEGLKANDALVIEFPMVESEETYALKWTRKGGWSEFSVGFGGHWVPPENPEVYTLRLRGNTLIDVGPRTDGPGLALYQRDSMKNDTAPMRKVRRFVSPITFEW